MAKSRSSSDSKDTPSFRPRRTVAPVGDAAEKRVVVRAYMPASLAKDITLYALERDCSVSDLLNSILRRAIPSLKVVSVPNKMDHRRGELDSASDGDPIGAENPEAAESAEDATPRRHAA